MSQHLHQPTVAVLQLLHILVAEARVVEGEVEAEGPRGHRGGEEGAASLPGVVYLRLIVHYVDCPPVVQRGWQIRRQLS
jgi:hypothetical protein